MLEVLSPLEAAVKELNKNNATLLTAEGVFKFLFTKFNELKTQLSEIMLLHIKKRMNGRRHRTLLTLLIYLETGNVPRSTPYFEYTTKAEAINLAGEIFERVHVEDNTNENLVSPNIHHNNEVLNETNRTNSLQQQKEAAISSITHVQEQVRTGSSLLQRDFIILGSCKKRTENLNILFNALLKIKPTSTATERVFSIAGLTKTRVRTRLSFETFNAIICLKYYFF